MGTLITNLCRSPPSPAQRFQSKDTKTWNLILKNHAKLKDDRAILSSYEEMEALCVPPSKATLPLVLKACSQLRDVELGRRIHSHIIGSCLIEDVRIRTALVDFYCKCGLVDIAQKMFDEMDERDLVSWNVIICGYVGSQRYEDAIRLFFQMIREGVKPSAVTLVSILSACGGMSEFRLGRQIHCYCLRHGLFFSEAHLGTALIGFYSRFGVRLSRNVFDLMLIRNIVTWNAMLSIYIDEEDIAKALELFFQILMTDLAPDSVTFLEILQSCLEFEHLELGKQVHQLTIKNGFYDDKYVQNALITMYGKCGNLELACDVFKKMQSRDLASWNAMLSAYKNRKYYDKAFDLFNRMLMEGIEENVITLTTILSICSDSGELEKGAQLHAHVLKTGKHKNVGSALLSMYSDLGHMASALLIFNELEPLDAVSWNTLIMGLSRNQLVSQAWDFLRQMLRSRIELNSYSMVSVLEGCKDESCLSVGRSIHGYIIRHGLEFNSSLCTALTDMYIDCGYESSAVHLFRNFPKRDIVSWNAMVASYVRNGHPREGIKLFYQMQSEVQPNYTTMVNVLPACANMGDLQQGRCLHAYIIRRGLCLSSDISMENALLTMYAKCGSIGNALTIFGNLSRKDVISWNAMIAAYGMHGHGEEAVNMFYQMLKMGERPTSVTFISILSACSHTGLVEEGCEIFYSMAAVHNIAPDAVHYSCMVDLFARAGFMDEANALIHSMPLEPDPSLWRAHLAGYQVFPITTMARLACEKLIKMEPTNTGNYILLSNIHAAAGSWEDVNILRSDIKEKGLKKSPGVSWIVLRNKVHSFTAGDISHPQLDIIHTTLRLLINQLTENGYAPDSSFILHDVMADEESKFLDHSEKMID